MKQIKQHLAENGYNRIERAKIEGFLVGEGYEASDLEFIGGDRSFEEFLEWYRTSVKRKNVRDLNAFVRCYREAHEELRKESLFEQLGRIFNPASKIVSDREKVEEAIKRDSELVKEMFEIVDLKIHPINTAPIAKFSVGDKIQRIKDESHKPYKITKVVFKKGKPRYNATALDGSGFMCGVREGKIEAYEEKSECKFKVGDYVRTENGTVWKIKDIEDGVALCSVIAYSNAEIDRYEYHVYYLDDLELYIPKSGEFYYCKSKNGKESIAYKSNVHLEHSEGYPTSFEYACRCANSELLSIFYLYLDDLECIAELRPATPTEKAQLIKAVEEKYGKTYDEDSKEWVEVKKDERIDKITVEDIISVSKKIKPMVVWHNPLRDAITYKVYSDLRLPDLSFSSDTFENMSTEAMGKWYSTPLYTKREKLKATFKPTKADQFGKITSAMADLYKRKNKDYGDSFSNAIDRRGFGSAVDRLYDKVDRLNQLLVENNSAGVKDESVIDTLTDLANYAIMTRIEVENRSERKQ